MDPTEFGCGRSQCHCFRDCADIADKDFQKIVELEDTGVALYRYVPPSLDPTKNIGEIFILRTDEDVELQPDNFTSTFAKNKINCPRCIKLIEKAEELYGELPCVKQQDVAGVCDHCWKPVTKMQRLAELARRETNVKDPTAEEALKLQMLEAMGTKDGKKIYEGPKQRPFNRQGPRAQFDRMRKEGQPIEKEESLMTSKLRPKSRPSAAGDKSRTEKSKDEEVKKKREGEEKNKLEPKEVKDKEYKSKDKEDKSKDKEDKTKNKEAKTKEDKLKQKELKDKEDKTKDKEDKYKDKEDKSKDKAKKSGDDDELKRQIAQMAKEKQEAERIRKQQQQEKELAERKAKEAERLKELERQKNEVKPKLKPQRLHSDTEDDDGEMKDSADFKAPPINEIIIGEKICMNRRTEQGEVVQNIENAEKVKSMNAGKVQKVDPGNTDKVHDTDNTKEEKLNSDKPGPNNNKELVQQGAKIPNQESSKSILDKSGKQKNINTNTRTSDGVIRYALSDRTFIDKGWTLLPLEKVVRKMNVYRMRPARPEFDWFEHNKNKRLLEYDTGEMLAQIDDSGRGRWYYRSGKLAMDYYDAQETNAGQRIVIYSTGTPDERGRPRPRTVLATFDYSGNGIVFDHTGKIRLKYNQTEGVVLDRALGPVSHWKWHTLNDPPVLQQVMIDTQLAHKDPTIMSLGAPNADAPRQDDDAMLAIEFDNFIKEKTKKSSQNFKPFQIKMKALKINEHFSLRVLDQASVHLIYRDGSANLKMNIGMVLDHREIVDTETAEIGDVSNKVTQLPACTNSIAELQEALGQARALEGLRVLRERHILGPGVGAPASVDILRAPTCRPRARLACVTSYKDIAPPTHKPPCSCDCYKDPLF